MSANQFQRVIACTCVVLNKVTESTRIVWVLFRVRDVASKYMARTKQTAPRTSCGTAPRVQLTRITCSKTRLVRGASVASTVSLSSLTTVPLSPAQSLHDTLEIVQVDQQRLEEHLTNRVRNIDLQHCVDTDRNTISTVIFVMTVGSPYSVVSPVRAWCATVA